MSKDINSFEYFEEMTTDWSRLDLLRRCYDLCNEMVEKQQEIERLNNIINEFEDILKTDIKACNNKFENMFDRNYRRLILEEKLEQLQELKGSDKE